MSEEKLLYLGIVGSRRRNDYSDFSKVYDAYGHFRIRNNGYEIVIVSGGANRGGDDFAVRIARLHGHTLIVYFPNIPDEFMGKYRYSDMRITKYYYERNAKIAKKSDALIAAPVINGGGGTGNTIKHFRRFHPRGELIIV